MSFLQPSPITGSYWGDARGPVGFLGGVSNLIMDNLVAVRKDVRQTIAKAHDAACVFAALPVLAYTGEEGLVMSRAYEAAQETERRVVPLLDDLFKMNHTHWRSFVMPSEDPCYYCGPGGLQPNVADCDYCDGSGVRTYEGQRNDVHLGQRALRVAFLTTRVIRRVVTTRDTRQVSDELNNLLDAGVVEAQAADIPHEVLEKLELAWRFYAVAKRMPKDDEEELFLAFQAAWDAGNYDFAAEMVQLHEAS